MTTAGAATEDAGTAGRLWLRLAFSVALWAAFAGFIGLGVWQLQRMAWKHDLIHRVQTRIHAEPVALPDPARWASIDAASDEYRRIRIEGHFLDVAPARVQAVTELGPGWWLLLPFQTAHGDIVLVNRGYIRPGIAPSPALPQAPTTVTGLLRISEPGGGFLRNNVPAEDRWYSRDVAAIAIARELDTTRVAPFFIDADHSTSPGGTAGSPLGGLTVVSFRDSHLTYALTWFGMALLTLTAGVLLYRSGPDLRHHRSKPNREPRDAVSAPGR